MSNYGRNFEFRIPPKASARQGRYSIADDGDTIPIGAPIVVNHALDRNVYGHSIVELADAAEPRGAGGEKGILVYEYAPAAFAGDDPLLTTYSDKDVALAGFAVQMVAGDPAVKVVLRNTTARLFLGVRSYPGRIMVAGLGATPTLQAGDFLAPGVGNDTDGYWAETTEDDAWLEITLVDTARAEVEARMLF